MNKTIDFSMLRQLSNKSHWASPRASIFEAQDLSKIQSVALLALSIFIGVAIACGVLMSGLGMGAAAGAGAVSGFVADRVGAAYLKRENLVSGCANPKTVPHFREVLARLEGDSREKSLLTAKRYKALNNRAGYWVNNMGTLNQALGVLSREKIWNKENVDQVMNLDPYSLRAWAGLVRKD